MKRVKDKAAFLSFVAASVALLMAVMFTTAGAPAAVAFLASYGVATIGGTKPVNRLIGATCAGLLAFAAVSLQGARP